MDNDKKIAVLIDADNVSYKYVKYIFDEISKHGKPTYKRIYGDWTKPNLNQWGNVLLNYSITAIQQYSYTIGKNASDSALIIDAMDILYSGHVDGFCIVSSDSDFTRLAARLREAGMFVLGMGEKKTLKPFISACEKFIYLEVLENTVSNELRASASTGQDKQDQQEQTDAPKAGMASKEELIIAIKAIITELSDDDGWAFLGQVGSTLSRRYPDFDTRNFGFSKLTPFISSLKHFEIKTRKTTNPNINHKFVKIKE